MSLLSDLGERSRVSALSTEPVGCCPACGGEKRELLYAELQDTTPASTHERWTLFKCSQCHSAYLDPRPDRESIHRAYQDYFTHFGAAPGPAKGPMARWNERLRRGYLNARWGYRFKDASGLGSIAYNFLPLQRARGDYVVRSLVANAGARLLDVGCGRGEFVAFMATTGWKAKGIDLDPKAVAQGQSSGADVDHGSVENLEGGRALFDAVTLSHVIEHVHDPLGALRRCKALTRLDGSLWIATPNLDSLTHAYAGRYWIGLDPPRHLQVFTLRGLKIVCERAGWERVQVESVPLASGSLEASIAVRDRSRGQASTRGWVRTGARVVDALNDIAGHFRAGRGEVLVATAINRG